MIKASKICKIMDNVHKVDYSGEKLYNVLIENMIQ